MNKIIETTLPLTELNKLAIKEKAGKIGHPANLHMWWGRSPISSSTAALCSAVMDYSDETIENDMNLIAQIASGDEDALNTVRERFAASDNLLTVWDPFSGFGSFSLAAHKLGMAALANDLNPVASVLTRAVVDIPGRFFSQKPVHPGTAKNINYFGAEGLAEDLEFYGEWVENQALKKLAHIYPQMPNGEIPFTWLWVRTVKCPNPVCNCNIPLANSYVLSNSKTAQYWAEPVVEEGFIHFVIHEGKCPPGKESNKTVNFGARFRCPVCGEITTDEYIKKMGEQHKLGAKMMAVVTNVGGKKFFYVPDEMQQTAADVIAPDDIPPGAMPVNPHWYSPPSFGITSYADLFTARQLLMLTTFSDLVREVQDIAASDALASEMSEISGSLADGGNGALAYGQAIGIYLALVIDKMVDYNSSICSWRTVGGNIRSTFGRQAIPMVWTFAEGNPFSNVSGNFKTLLKSVVDSVRCLGNEVPAIVFQDNAVTMEYPHNVLVCTELPYYKDIGYADLSDFFYIWLRRSLKNIYPQMFSSIVTPKNELSTVSTYYGVPKEEAEDKYKKDMKLVCKKLYECSSADYPALLFYCFRKSDLEYIKSGSSGKNESAWEFMLESLMDCGFAITAIWPMRLEAASVKADSTRVLIVANKKHKRQNQVTRRAFINTLKHKLPVKLNLLFSASLMQEDEMLSCMGQGFSIFTQYQAVINADGSKMCVHDALQIIYLECIEYLMQKNAVAGKDTMKAREE
ncbi:MAG: hypothetical protein DBY32_02640 [Phascolarctobacterium sp.]|nr:MAG: hypothetical protein DBY32_02640 [Phascolarctobacterium sp.]